MHLDISAVFVFVYIWTSKHKTFGHDRTWTCIVPDGTRTRNVQIRGLTHSPLCHERLYQLSYMAGERSLIEESTTHTTLQHALQIKSCPSLKCLCKESRCYAQLQICVFCVADRGLGLVSLIWTQDQTKQSLSLCSIGRLILSNQILVG